jgi:hypothetical protein
MQRWSRTARDRVEIVVRNAKERRGDGPALLCSFALFVRDR